MPRAHPISPSDIALPQRPVTPAVRRYRTSETRCAVPQEQLTAAADRSSATGSDALVVGTRIERGTPVRARAAFVDVLALGAPLGRDTPPLRGARAAAHIDAVGRHHTAIGTLRVQSGRGTKLCQTSRGVGFRREQTSCAFEFSWSAPCRVHGSYLVDLLSCPLLTCMPVENDMFAESRPPTFRGRFSRETGPMGAADPVDPNAPTSFAAGLALVLGPTLGIELGALRVPVLGSWWMRGLLVLVGVPVPRGDQFSLVLHCDGAWNLSRGARPPVGPEGPRRPSHRLAVAGPWKGIHRRRAQPSVPICRGRADVFNAVRDDILSNAARCARGDGGRGNTILAGAAEYRPHPDVQADFPAGIAWVEALSRPRRHSCKSDSPLDSSAMEKSSRSRLSRWAENRLAELLAGRACPADRR